ncbi:MAG: anaerobic ribonucleoside-triphosphate reductase activating protein [Halanaerobiales bacterium]
MKIAGVQKTSLVDYPGEIVTTLFTQGCNLRCPFCHNPELIPLEDVGYNLDTIKGFLKNRKDYITGVCITGGEPLLQDTEILANFLLWIRNQGLKIKLDTNGTFPEKLKLLLHNKLLNCVAMDVKLPLNRYVELGAKQQNLNSINKSIEYILSSNIDYEFRTTVIPSLHDKNDIENIVKMIKGANKYAIQNFDNFKCLDSNLESTLAFTESELISFKEIADKYVDIVVIRN